MIVGVIQSSYIPWRGYFDFIASVDLFVFLEDAQFSTQSWRNRNRIKTQSGLKWLTVPVRHRSLGQLISETEVDDLQHWERTHTRSLRQHYARAPYLDDALALLADLPRTPGRTISQVNLELARRICAYLGIQTPLVISSDLRVAGTRTERLVEIVRSVGGDIYLSGPSAQAYLELDRFRAAEIAVRYKSYAYRPYPQQWGDFQGAVTILDLIANCGPASSQYLRSDEPDRTVLGVG